MGLFVTGLFQNIQEQTKALVFVFVFVLVDEQAITKTVRLTCEQSRIPLLPCYAKGLAKEIASGAPFAYISPEQNYVKRIFMEL